MNSDIITETINDITVRLGDGYVVTEGEAHASDSDWFEVQIARVGSELGFAPISLEVDDSSTSVVIWNLEDDGTANTTYIARHVMFGKALDIAKRIVNISK